MGRYVPVNEGPVDLVSLANARGATPGDIWADLVAGMEYASPEKRDELERRFPSENSARTSPLLRKLTELMRREIELERTTNGL